MYAANSDLSGKQKAALLLIALALMFRLRSLGIS